MGKCVFNNLWLKTDVYCAWLLSTPDKHKARCSLCQKDLDISQMGESALKSHMLGKKHQTLLDAKNKSPMHMKSFFAGATTENSCRTTVPTTESSTLASYVSRNDVLDAEIRWVLKCVDSNYSFNSCEGISSFFKTLFSDSDIAKQFSCCATKCAYIVCFGLAPYFKSAIFKCLDETQEYCLLFDESLNHTTQNKQLDLHVRYWDEHENQVRTRYFDSLFLGHSTADIMLCAIKKAVERINLAKLFNLSMDGPAVNWKLFNMLQRDIEKENNTKLLNIGSCSIHTVHNAIKNAANITNWDIDTFLISLYSLFKDSPARREDYLKSSKTGKIPKHFCRHRWLENGPATERALEIWEDLKEFVYLIEREKLPRPTCKSYDVISRACHDILMPVKLNVFLSIIKILQPFLIKYQSDSPLLPFLANDLKKLVLDCLITFNVMKKEELSNLKTCHKLSVFDFSDKSSYSDASVTSLGFIGNKELKEIKKRSAVTEKQVMDLKRDCQRLIYKLVENIVTKTPIQYALVRNISCLDPKKMISDSHGCFTKMKNILSILVDAQKVDEKCCDAALIEFQEFLSDIIENSTDCEAFDPSVTRLDNFFYSYFSAKRYENIWQIIKKLLILSHGQASVERGFSINKQIEVENLHEKSFISKRLVIDQIKVSGGLENILITKELRLSVSSARQKYMAYLEEKKKEDIEEVRKRKNSDELQDLKCKKTRLEKSILDLQESADKLSEKAEKTGNIQFIVQSNSFRRTVKQKTQEIKDIDSQINEILNSKKK